MSLNGRILQSIFKIKNVSNVCFSSCLIEPYKIRSTFQKVVEIRLWFYYELKGGNKAESSSH
jgi:hypothetical protein